MSFKNEKLLIQGRFLSKRSFWTLISIILSVFFLIHVYPCDADDWYLTDYSRDIFSADCRQGDFAISIKDSSMYSLQEDKEIDRIKKYTALKIKKIQGDKAYIPQVRDLRFWNYSRLIFTFLHQ